MSAYMEKGREILHSQSFSRLLGTELVALSEGEAILELPITKDFKQSYGFVHGGVISYLADNCLTFAGATYLGNCVTSEYKINYTNPSMGDTLRAVSTVLSYSLRQAVCECRVYTLKQSNEVLTAVAQGTIVKVENVA